MNQSEGILLYEIILLALGILFFLVLLFSLVYFVIKKRSIKTLIPFFVISVIMMGWPSIQKIGFLNNLANIEKYQQELKQNPADLTVREELTRSLAKIEKRPILNPATFIKLADAYAVIGDTIKALKYVDKALNKNPDSKVAIEKKLIFDTPRIRAESEIVKLKQNPSDSVSRRELVRNLDEIEKLPSKNQNAWMTIAKGKVAIGDTMEAKRYLDSALIYLPQSEEVIKLKEDLSKH
jgi:tetratricopeptide (TPR) repeat protein